MDPVKRKAMPRTLRICSRTASLEMWMKRAAVHVFRANSMQLTKPPKLTLMMRAGSASSSASVGVRAAPAMTCVNPARDEER